MPFSKKGLELPLPNVRASCAGASGFQGSGLTKCEPGRQSPITACPASLGLQVHALPSDARIGGLEDNSGARI